MPLPGREKKDLLGATGSQHKRSTHAKDNMISVTVRKDDPSEKAGIRLSLLENGRVVVTAVAKNGLFADSEVEVGDIVLSINGKRLRKGEGAEALVNVVEKAEDKVTAVVKKANMKDRKERKKIDRGKTEDNNKETKKSYEGIAVHNPDGSLKLGAVKTEDANGPDSQIAIAASKVSKDQDIGLKFQVQDKMLFVVDIDEDSIFHDSALAIGDRVVSINDMNFRSFADANYAMVILKKAEVTVTIVVEKGHENFKPDPTVAVKEASKDKNPVKRSSSKSKPGVRRSKSKEGSDLVKEDPAPKRSLKKNKSSDDALISKNSTRSTSGTNKSAKGIKKSSTKDKASTKKSDTIPKSSARSSGASSKKKKAAPVKVPVPSDEEDEELMALWDSDDSSSGGSFGEESTTASMSDSLEEDVKKAVKEKTSKSDMPDISKMFHKETTITAPKEFAKQDVGISFVLRENLLLVSAVSRKSIFMSTSLDVGDRVLSINDQNFRINPDQNKASLALKTSKEAVSLIVQKARKSFKEEKFDLDGSTSDLVW
jgi:C-terminal processing protease CtpA/Prc